MGSCLQSTLVNPELLLSGNLLFGQNFPTPKFFIIPVHVSVRKCLKKIHCNTEILIRNLALIRNKFNRILNFLHIY